MTEKQKKEMNEMRRKNAKEVINKIYGKKYMNKPYNLLINHRGRKTLLVNTMCVKNCLHNKIMGFNLEILSVRNAPKNIDIIDVIYEKWGFLIVPDENPNPILDYHRVIYEPNKTDVFLILKEQ